MAPTQLLLEGPAIEPLLQRVRAEHGPDVRIVKAERVRVGGIVGFFAREQFEVTVEVGAEGALLSAHALLAGAPASAGGPSAAAVAAAPPPRPALAAAPPVDPGWDGHGGLDALLAAAEAAEAADRAGRAAGSQPTATPPAAPPAQPPAPSAALPSPVPLAPAPLAPAPLAPAPPSVAAPAAAPVHQPSAFDAILRAVDAAAAVPAPRHPTAPTTPEPAPEPAPDPAPAEDRAPTPAAGGQLPEDPWPEEDLPWASASSGQVAATLLARAPAPATTPAPVAAPRVAAAPEPAPESAPASPAAAGTRRARHRTPVPVEGTGPGEHLGERLAGLGVPGRWLVDLPEDRTQALRRLSERIAATPAQDLRRGTVATSPVVVVLADLDGALPVARSLAVGLGLDADEVVVMHRRVPGAPRDRCLPARADVLVEADRARQRRRALVLVLPAPVGAGPAASAALADTLLLLRPDEVWAVVDATRRLQDSSAWLRALVGGRGVDAVALTNVDATCAPAAALDLPAPVVLLGDRPATPEVWVSLLAARLIEQDLS